VAPLKKTFVSLAVLLLVSTTALAAAPVGDRPIEYGARGGEVKAVQTLLADTGYYAGAIDGVFGDATLAALKRFQTYNGLSPDGVIGPETIAALRRERALSAPIRYRRTLTMTATAYTAEDAGTTNLTYRGHRLRRGLVAVDPRVIPLGTRLYVVGYGYAIADDIGGAIKGNKIDLAFENHADAIQFGVQKVTVYILN